jgi:hypothetical protein
MVYSPVLFVHIAAGMTGMVTGTAALIFHKGSPRHALAGKLFVAAMLTMASTAIYLAVLKHQPSNVGGGILTFYMILTAWLTARRKDGETNPIDWLVLLIPIWLGVSVYLSGIEALRSPSPPKDGVPVGMHFFMGTIMLLAASGDLRMLLRHGVAGQKRIIRHLWRMCFGLFIATGSFFLGQGSKIFPGSWLESNFMIIPAVLPLVLLIFWFFRVRFSNLYKKNALSAATNLPST